MVNFCPLSVGGSSDKQLWPATPINWTMNPRKGANKMDPTLGPLGVDRNQGWRSEEKYIQVHT